MLDQVLVLRCQAGDETAFAELMARYHPRLSFFLRKLVGDPHLAEDLAQETWFDIYRAMPRLAEPRAFAAWAYRIARDRAFRQLRRRGLLPQPLDAATEPISVNSAEADGEFTAEDVAQLYAALDKLAPEHREVILLRFIEEMSYEEIAAATAAPLGTVRSRLHYAKLALRSAMQKETRS